MLYARERLQAESLSQIQIMQVIIYRFLKNYVTSEESFLTVCYTTNSSPFYVSFYAKTLFGVTTKRVQCLSNFKKRGTIWLGLH